MHNKTRFHFPTSPLPKFLRWRNPVIYLIMAPRIWTSGVCLVVAIGSRTNRETANSFLEKHLLKRHSRRDEQEPFPTPRPCAMRERYIEGIPRLVYGCGGSYRQQISSALHLLYIQSRYSRLVIRFPFDCILSHSFLRRSYILQTMRASTLFFGALALLPILVVGQLSGHVGPLTSTSSKASKTCNVLNYGAKADKTTDIGPPLASAWAACQTGGTVVIPAGDYAMSTWVTLKNGKAVALQLDGVIYRTGSAGGNMIMIRDTQDFEMHSSTGKGAVQGK